MMLRDTSLVHTLLGHKMFKNALTACVALANAAYVGQYNDGALVYTVTWVSVPLATYPTFGADVSLSATAGSSVAVTWSGDEVVVYFLGGDPTVPYVNDLVVTGLAGLVSPISLASVMPVDTGADVVLHSCVVPYRITGAGAGSHTVTFTMPGGGLDWFVLGYSTPSPTPPTVGLCMDPDIGTSWGIDAPYDLGSVATLATYRADVRAVVSAFNGVNGAAVGSIDLNEVWLSGHAQSSVDHIHPNDIGTDQICSPIEDYIQTLTPRAGLNYL
ncbi:MAG: hypothetical protein ACRDYC_05580 [Acidimicrobiales bacterium]